MGLNRLVRARLRRLRSETGFTLIEVLVATSLSLILLMAIAGFASFAQKRQADTGNRSDALIQGRAALERITRDLRQATSVNATTPGMITLRMYGAGGTSLRDVRYDCRTNSRCDRFEGPAGGTLTATNTPLIGDGGPSPVSQVQSATFTASTIDVSQDYVEVEIQISLPGRPLPITLSDGVHLRNQTGS